MVCKHTPDFRPYYDAIGWQEVTAFEGENGVSPNQKHMTCLRVHLGYRGFRRGDSQIRLPVAHSARSEIDGGDSIPILQDNAATRQIDLPIREIVGGWQHYSLLSGE